MSHQSLYNHSVVWRPDTCTVPKHMLIDPQAKPMDEVWRFVKTCCQVFMAKWRVWSYRKEDIDELEQNIYMHCYFLLVWRVRNGRYNRQYSFYHNVRSCAMSTVASEVRAWLPKIKDKLNNVDIECRVVGSEGSGVRLIDTLSAKPAWKTPGEAKDRRHSCLPDKVTQREAKTLRRYIDADYNAYLDDCEEFGISSRLSLQEYIQSNYTDEEYRIYVTNTDTVEYRRERRRKQREAANRANYEHYDVHKERCREAMRRLRARNKVE